MESLHVALDLDDVILAFVEGVCEAVSRDFGITITEADVKEWYFGQYLDPIIGHDWWEWLEDHAWLWGEKFKPVPGAIGTIEQLRADGHWLEIVTAKPTWAEDQVWTWLARYRPRVHQVTIAGMDGHDSKSKAELSPNADVLVDDRPENCVIWAKTDRLALLYTRPHNLTWEPEEETENIIRVYNWGDVRREINLEAGA